MEAGDRFDPATLKHLEFIEAVIARLAGNGFFLKGWALTVAAALFGFAANKGSWRIAATGLLPVLAFWALDAYFLHRERLFRELYKAVVKGDPRVEPLAMPYEAFGTSCGYWKAIWAMPLWVFYLALCGVGVILIALTASRLGV